jgi:ABC-type transporter Mla subunit MlaD
MEYKQLWDDLNNYVAYMNSITAQVNAAQEQIDADWAQLYQVWDERDAAYWAWRQLLDDLQALYDLYKELTGETYIP